MTATSSGGKRITVNLNQPGLEALEDIQQAFDVSMTQAVVMALRTLQFLIEADADGCKVVVEDPEGVRERVKLL